MKITLRYYLLLWTCTSSCYSFTRMTTLPGRARKNGVVPRGTTTNNSLVGPQPQRRKRVCMIESASDLSWQVQQQQQPPFLALLPWHTPATRRRFPHQQSSQQPPLLSRAKLLLSLTLAANAGFVNGVCLSSGGGQAVAAVTGAWTHAALAAQAGNVRQCTWLAAVILSYVTGSAVAGFLGTTTNPSQQQHADHQQQQHASLRPLAICATLLTLAVPLLGAGRRVGYLLAAAALGLQNSVTSTLTGNLCRTAHMSGATSDIGTLFGQWVRARLDNHRQGQHGAVPPKLPLLLGLTASFGVGGYAAGAVVPLLGRATSLLVPAAVYMAMVGLHEASFVRQWARRPRLTLRKLGLASPQIHGYHTIL